MDAGVRADASQPTDAGRSGDASLEVEAGVREAGLEPATDGGGDPEPPHDAGDASPTADASTPSPDDDAGSAPDDFEVLAVTPERELDEPTSSIRVRFSAELDRTSLDASTFQVKRGAEAVRGELASDGATAEFRPERPWTLAARYSVELTAGLRDAEGRALEPHTIELHARDGQWSVSGISPALHQPRSHLAVAPSGEAAVAWVYGGVQLRAYSPDRGWTETERVSTETERVFYPSMAINARGRIVVSWNYETNPVGRVYLPEGGWQPHFYFRGVPGGGQEVRRASWILSDEGDAAGAFSVFRLPPVENGTVDAIRFHVESEERHVHAVSASDRGFDTDPDLGWLGDQPLFAWVEDVRSDPDTPRPEIRVRLGEAETHAMSAPQSHARSPAVASSPDRRTAWLVWEQVEDTEASLWAAKLTSDGSRGAPERISQTYEATPLEANPALAVDSHGAVHVVWEQPTAAIWTARFDPSGGWAPPSQLSAADAHGTQPSIALEPGGHALLLWAAVERGMDHESSPVMAARYLAGSGWSTPSELARDDHGASMLSDRVQISVGVDDTGRGWACWTGAGQLNLARFE